MFQQILETEKRMRNVGFRPVQKCASTATDDDVSGIEVSVSQSVWDLQSLDENESILNLLLKPMEFAARQRSWRNFALLFHELGHRIQERRHDIRKNR